MNIVNALLALLNPAPAQEPLIVPNGVCPNCWGRDEYGGRFYERVQQENLNINSKTSNVGWVAAYANKHLLGIVLKRKGNGASLVCEACQTSFQHTESAEKAKQLQ